MAVAAAVTTTAGATDPNLVIIAAAIGAGGALLGAVLGAAGAFLTGRLTARANLQLEGERRRLADRREARAFQRETLLSVLEVMTRYGRVTAKIRAADDDAYARLGHYTMMSPDLARESYDVGVDFGHLIERVVDDNLRAALNSVHEPDMTLVLPKDPTMLDEAFKAFAARLVTARQQLGIALRGYLLEE